MFATAHCTFNSMSHQARPVKRSEPAPSIDGRKIHIRRRKAKLSLRALAEKTGLGFSTISQMENGRRTNPSLAAAAALASALDCQITDLMPDVPDGNAA